MRYSMKCVDWALLLVFPGSEVWPTQINRVSRLNMAAKEFFLNPKKSLESFDMGCADLVIRTALQELESEGEMRFGSYNVFTDNTADF